MFGRSPYFFPNIFDPSWLVEGLAVYYESKLTGSGRIEGTEHRMIARTAALQGAFPRLDQISLLQSNRGVVSGAGYTDVNARLPALWILFGLAILAGLVLLANARLRGWRLPLAAVGLLAGLSIVVGGLYPAVVQRLKVKPDGRRSWSAQTKHPSSRDSASRTIRNHGSYSSWNCPRSIFGI